MQQKIITAADNYKDLDYWIINNGLDRVLLVCGNSIERQTINGYLQTVKERFGVDIVRFMDFTPNPSYESVQKGVKVFHDEGCQGIIAVGGGSSMDVAKCIKLFSNMNGKGEHGSWLKQEAIPNKIPFLAVPTTAGTGSEATRFAVIYYDGAKQSITSESIIPQTVLMDSGVLKTLPEYQKKATMMDALCHAIESYWSVNSTAESKQYSKQAIQMILANMQGYLVNTDEGNAGMLIAANMAGKAINITQTTAGHAMCYKITSLFGCAHGHAAILCDRALYPWMIDNAECCCDPRGVQYLAGVLDEIGQTLGCANAKQGAQRLKQIFDTLELEVPSATAEQFRELQTSVNPVRLRNHPIMLTPETIDELYHQILREKK